MSLRDALQEGYQPWQPLAPLVYPGPSPSEQWSLPYMTDLLWDVYLHGWYEEWLNDRLHLRSVARRDILVHVPPDSEDADPRIEPRVLLTLVEGLTRPRTLVLPTPDSLSLEDQLDRWLSEQRHRLEVLRGEGKGTVQSLVGQTLRLERVLDFRDPVLGWLRSMPAATVHLAGLPEVDLTSAPSTITEISVGKRTSTAGCLVTHSVTKNAGVTASLHMIEPGRDVRIAEGSTVHVGSVPLVGTVRKASVAADACFVEVATSSFTKGRGAKGALALVGPATNLPVEFEGYASLKTSTVVDGHDRGIPFASAGTQLRVYTPWVTQSGDSGAALIDTSADLVIGFAYERTTMTSSTTFSSWIWAQTVLDELSVDL